MSGATPTGATSAVVPEVRRIAVLRANSIGDFLFALPALQALRATYPDAQITLLGRRWHASFLMGRGTPVDRVLVVPPLPGVTLDEGSTQRADPAQLDRFVARAKACRFDLALQMHGGGRNSNPLVARLGARVTAGMRATDAPALDRWIRHVYWQREPLRLLEVAALVGARPVGLSTAVPVLERDRQEAQAALARTGRDVGRPLVLLNPNATDPKRRWPLERFAQVGDRLQQAGAQIGVVGDGADRARAARLLGLMRAPALDLAGAVSLGALAALLAQADLVVSNDSGPLHLAEAVGTASVGLYWWGNLVNFGSSDAHLHRAVPSWDRHCPACGADAREGRCPHDASMLESIEVGEVLEQAEDLMALMALMAPGRGEWRRCTTTTSTS